MTFTAQPETPPSREDSDGALRVGASRVLLELVVRAFQDGATPETIVQRYSTFALADPAMFDWEFAEHADGIAGLVALAAGYATPEDIDDGAATAPCKRIINKIPEYAFRKASAGPVIASKIGLAVMRQKCLHFHGWLAKIEALAG